MGPQQFLRQLKAFRSYRHFPARGIMTHPHSIPVGVFHSSEDVLDMPNSMTKQPILGQSDKTPPPPVRSWRRELKKLLKKKQVTKSYFQCKDPKWLYCPKCPKYKLTNFLIQVSLNIMVGRVDSHKTYKFKSMSGPKHPGQVSEPIKC